MNFLRIFASQKGCSIEKNKEFGEILESIAGGEYICIMTDFNAQREKDRNGCKNIQGTRKEGEGNIEGEGLLDTSKRNDWAIGLVNLGP